MEITLRINGEDKTFVQEFAPLKIYRKALEIEKYAEQEDFDESELLDRRINLLVEIFDHQFTKDQVENGLNSVKHNEVLYNIIGVNILGFKPLDEIKKEEFDLGKFLAELRESESQSTKQSNK